MPKVDYADAENGGFEPVADGIYPAKLTNWELRYPKEGATKDDGSPKHPYYNLEFTAQEDAGLGNRKFWLISSIDPKALWRFKDTMIALGAKSEDLAPGSEVDTDDIVADCMEEPCRLVLKQVPYTKRNGDPGMRSEIQDVLAADSPF